MSSPRWQSDLRQQFEAATAAEYIQLIQSLLDDETYTVIRQLASELILDLRNMRDLALRVDQIDDPRIKALVLFKASTSDAEDVTVAEFAQKLLSQIQDARHLLNCLQFYAMALAEQTLSAQHRPSC